MIRLMPYSTHEVKAIDAYFSQMATNGWQYSWRWLCFICFKKRTDAKALKCVPCKRDRLSGLLHIYRENELDADIALSAKGADSLREEVFYPQIMRNAIAGIIVSAVLIAAIVVFLAFCCVFSNWASVNLLWGMRGAASLLLPVVFCLAIDQAFLIVRLVKIRRFYKRNAAYAPCRNYIRYACALCAIALLLIQIVCAENAGMSTEQVTQYTAYATVLNRGTSSSDASIISTQFILEPESWESLFTVDGGEVRIAYHECRTGVGARNYFYQFRTDNIGTMQTTVSEYGVDICSANDENYCAIACVCHNQVLLITARNLGADTNAIANALARVFIEHG